MREKVLLWAATRSWEPAPTITILSTSPNPTASFLCSVCSNMCVSAFICVSHAFSLAFFSSICFVLFWLDFVPLYSFLDACLFPNRKAVDPDGKGEGEELQGTGGCEAVIRIYFTKNI